MSRGDLLALSHEIRAVEDRLDERLAAIEATAGLSTPDQLNGPDLASRLAVLEEAVEHLKMAVTALTNAINKS